MNQVDTLNSFLHSKIERQALLKAQSQQLDDLDIEIVGSKFGRWFNTSYLRIKRVLTLIVGIALVLLAITFLLFPELLIQDEQFKSELIQDSKAHYAEMAGETFRQTLLGLASKSSALSVDEILVHLDHAIDKSIEDEILASIRFFAAFILIFAFVLLYISRLTLKSRLRNTKITEAESLIQQIIHSFKASIDEGEKEIELLKQIISAQQNNPGSV